MLKYVIGINLPFLVAGAIIYFFYLKNLKESIQFVGEIRCRWNSRFEMEFFEGKIAMLVLILYLAYNIYLLVKFPGRISSYSFIGILFLVFGFYPRWIVLIGEKGIIMKTKPILWEELERRQLQTAGKRSYLELWVKGAGGLRRIRLKIPSKCREFFEKRE